MINFLKNMNRYILVHIPKIITIWIDSNWCNYDNINKELDIFEIDLFYFCNNLSLILSLLNFSIRFTLGGFYNERGCIFFKWDEEYE